MAREERRLRQDPAANIGGLRWQSGACEQDALQEATRAPASILQNGLGHRAGPDQDTSRGGTPRHADKPARREVRPATVLAQNARDEEATRTSSRLRGQPEEPRRHAGPAPEQV